MSLVITLVIISAILLFVLFVPIGIGAKYEKGAFVIVKVAFLSFDISVNRVMNKSQKNKKPEKEKKLEEEIDRGVVGLDFILSLLGDFRRFVRKRFTLSDFEMYIKFGTSDAASTAVYTGHLWSLAYNLLSLVDKLVAVEKPKVEITPVFNDLTFSISAKGIITTRIAHIIATATVFAYKFFKYKRNKRRRNLK